MSVVDLGRTRQLVRARALLFMTSTCEIRRHAKPVFDISTGRAAAGGNTLIYSGLCRLWEVTGGGVVIVGEEEITQQNTQLSIPWDADPVPIKGDLAKILTSDDANMVGRVFAIQDMAKSGLLRPTRRFSVQLVEERNVS